YLSGFDEEPIIVKGNDTMRAVYTNLDGGVYSFKINAYNGDGTPCQEEISFTIEKKLSFFENKYARIGLLIIILVSVLGMIYGLLFVQKILKNKNSAIEKLSKEHEEAMKSSSAKNDYLANMSNEIKIPINAIVAKAGELLQITDESDANYDSIKSIYDSGNGIIDKMDDIILLAKIEAGKQTVINSAYSVSSIVYEIADEAMTKIGDRPIKFFVEIGDNVQDTLIGDYNKIKEILSRILDNAVRYTKEGSVSLAVDCFSYADRQHHDIVNIVFTISDTGIGIQENKLESIFEVYSIAENVKNNVHAGIGVSLAIAKGYADLINADLDAESVYGAGSTFTLSIDQKLPDKNSMAAKVSKIEDTVTKEAADKLWLPEVCALVVDDEDVSREVAVKILERFEMKIDVASSGLGAIDMVLNNDYDVVFLDLSMPVMNGIEVMKEIRELSGDGYEYLPIIAMETNAIEEDKEGLLEEGFTDSLLKPIDARRVAAILKDCLPQDKIRERTNDIEIYIEGSRFGEGLEKIKPYVDVVVAIEKIGGSIDVFNKLLKAYYSQNTYTAQELTEKHGKDARGFRNKIHAVKTSSINIGAMKLAHEAANMEAAINIGNRDYIKDNLEEVVNYLNETMSAIEEYLEYVENVTGISDEEYALRKQQEKENAVSDTIDITRLENIKYAALDGDYDTVAKELEELAHKEYSGEDKEFMVVLKESVEAQNTAVIDEIITTYIDLNM
ncbi:MAG: response regulator, partial [Wujia sp.]